MGNWRSATLFMTTNRLYSFLSPSLVNEIAKYGGDVQQVSSTPPHRARQAQEIVFFVVEPDGFVLDVAEPRPGRSHGEDSMYFDCASSYWVAALFMKDACRSADRRCRVSKPDG